MILADYTILYTFLISLNILFVLIVIAYFLISIDKKNKILNADFIHGKWIRQGNDLSGKPWYIQYTFIDNEFELEAEPRLEVKGKYKIVKETENLLLLELTVVQGEMINNARHLSIGLDKRNKILTIDKKDFKWKAEQ